VRLVAIATFASHGLFRNPVSQSVSILATAVPGTSYPASEFTQVTDAFLEKHGRPDVQSFEVYVMICPL